MMSTTKYIFNSTPKITKTRVAKIWQGWWKLTTETDNCLDIHHSSEPKTVEFKQLKNILMSCSGFTQHPCSNWGTPTTMLDPCSTPSGLEDTSWVTFSQQDLANLRCLHHGESKMFWILLLVAFTLTQDQRCLTLSLHCTA
jgi:hypothetical protein